MTCISLVNTRPDMLELLMVTICLPSAGVTGIQPVGTTSETVYSPASRSLNMNLPSRVVLTLCMMVPAAARGRQSHRQWHSDCCPRPCHLSNTWAAQQADRASHWLELRPSLQGEGDCGCTGIRLFGHNRGGLFGFCWCSSLSPGRLSQHRKSLSWSEFPGRPRHAHQVDGIGHCEVDF